MDNLKVGMVTGIYPPLIGGPAQQVSVMSKKLCEEGFHVSVITPQVRNTPEYEKKDGVEIYRVIASTPVRSLKLLSKVASITTSLLDLIKHKKINLLHAHTIPVGGIPSFVSKALTNMPFILKYPADWIWETLSKSIEINPRIPVEELWFSSIKANLLAKMQRILFQNCNAAIATTLFQKKVLEKMKIPSKMIHVIPNAVDPAEFHPTINCGTLKRTLQLENNKIVLTARRLEIYKGVKYLIMAAPEILKNNPDTKFLIIGEGSEEVHLKKIARRLKVDDKILFLGRISHKILPKYIALADVVVLPSLYEPFGILAIEALAMEKPVVASNVGGISEIVNHMKNGILVRPMDQESLAKGVITFLTDRELADKFGKHGRGMVLRNFSWQQVISKTKRLYADIVFTNAS